MLRRFGYLLLLLAIFLVALDFYQWFETGEFSVTALGARWFALHPASLNLAQAVIERYIWPPLWDPAITTLLLWPSWVLPLVLGAVLTFFGSGPRRDPVFGKIKRGV